MDPSQVDVPPLKDLTIDNITDNVKLINSQCPDPRLKYLLERLVQHVHDFARETRLSQGEWMTAIQFLTSVGQICTDVRQVRRWFAATTQNVMAHEQLVGVHSALRHPRSLAPCRQHRPSETTSQHRGHRPRTLPYPRCDFRAQWYPNRP